LIDLIDAPQQVRELDPEPVRSLAGSIARQGVVVPIVVRAAASATSWSPVRGLDRVRLHADVTILAKLTIALARGRARAVPLGA
jgi:ParB-like chromosome segregation protein Spo0J